MVERAAAGFPPKDRDWDTVAESAEFVQGRMRLGDKRPSFEIPPDGRVLVKNTETSSYMARGVGVELHSALIAPAFYTPREFCMNARYPLNKGKTWWGVPEDNIPFGEFGLVQVSGLAYCVITFESAKHKHVSVEGSTAVRTNLYGFPLVWSAATSGVSVDGLVMLGHTHCGPFDGVASGSISAGASGTVIPKIDGTNVASETVFNPSDGFNISDGEIVVFFWQRENDRFIIVRDLDHT